MSYPTYPSGYWYPNDFAEPVTWLPVVFAYSIMVSGAAMLFLAYIAYLLNRFKEVIPHMLVVGLSLFLVILLGPLADLRAPDNAWRMMVSPRILPTDANPGFSVMAFQGSITWPLVTLISIAFTLLYFSYPLYVRYRETGNPLYRILSLGISSEKSYAALEKPLKILALVGSIILVTWLVYPATLFMQTYNFVWINSMLLPIIFFTEYLLIDISIIVLLLWIIGAAKPWLNAIRSLSTIIAIASASAIVALTLQTGIWFLKFGGSPYYSSFTHLYSLITIAVALYIIALVLSLLSNRYIPLSIIASIAGIAGVIINRWNFIVKAQEIPRTGLGVVEVPIPPIEYAMIIGLFSLGIFLIIVLSSIFPLSIGVKRGEGP
ncbi:MAG: hypothetical protein QXI22_05155 [Sulfolobales archaeon]